MEALLGRKQFNQLGGLQLDRDVRMLVGGLGELTARTVRDRLARLSQVGRGRWGDGGARLLVGAWGS